MSVEAAKRALQAVNLMIDTGIGIMEAARRAGTSRRISKIPSTKSIRLFTEWVSP